MAGKKLPITSAGEMSKVMGEASKDIEPPKHVRMAKDDMPFFHNVIKEFARAEWSDHQLELAALLARTMAEFEREQWQMRKEGSVCYTDKGTPVINPRKTAVQMAGSTILQMRRSLSLHARAQGGEARDVAKRRKMAKAAEDDARETAEDDLIARPSLN
jgi:hypothetical protein